MKKNWPLCCALVWSFGSCCLAQTNCPADSLPSKPGEFSFPPMQLRTELTLDLPAPASASGPGGFIVSSNAPAKELSASTGASDAGLHTYNIREDRFYLVQNVERKPENLLESIVEPEVIHIGKTELSCSVITAVKRKNPLCLINPMFFNLSW